MSVGDPLSGRDLAAFVAAVESGTVQGAADALDLTQSAASKRVHALERRLGEPLLLRTPEGVRATAAGRRLYPEAKEALAALGRAESAVGDRTSAPVLRIAASHTIGEFLLPGWLAGFRSAGNPAAAHVEIVNSPGVVSALRAGRAEVGCVEGPDSADGMETLALMQDEIVAVVAPDHPWAAVAEVPVAELAAESFSTREPGSGTRAVVTERLREAGEHLHAELEVASIQSLKRAVLQGGFTLLSRLAPRASRSRTRCAPGRWSPCAWAACRPSARCGRSVPADRPVGGRARVVALAGGRRALAVGVVQLPAEFGTRALRQVHVRVDEARHHDAIARVDRGGRFESSPQVLGLAHVEDPTTADRDRAVGDDPPLLVHRDQQSALGYRGVMSTPQLELVLIPTATRRTSTPAHRASFRRS